MKLRLRRLRVACGRIAVLIVLMAVPALRSAAAASPRPREMIGPSARVHVTKHFRITHDVSEDDLRPLVARLESTYNAVARFSAALDFHGDASIEPLTIVLFNSQAAFRRQLAEMKIGAASVAGFYDQATNLAAFCNARDHDDLRAIDAEIASLQRRLHEPSTGNQTAFSRKKETIEEAIDVLRRRRDELIESYNRFTIQHEAAHQILFNLGVHHRGVNNPSWLAEGLATQFEVPQTDGSGKNLRVNQYRLGDFREALGPIASASRVADRDIDAAFRDHRLTPLEALIPDREFNRDDGKVVSRYAESWALVCFLHHEHPEAFAKYARKLSDRDSEETIPPQREIDEFTAAFGPPDEAFQRRFVRFILKQRVDSR